MPSCKVAKIGKLIVKSRKHKANTKEDEREHATELDLEPRVRGGVRWSFTSSQTSTTGESVMINIGAQVVRITRSETRQLGIHTHTHMLLPSGEHASPASQHTHSYTR
jgi:hypothetical protein